MADTSGDLPMQVDLLQAKERFDEANNAFRKAALSNTGATWLPEDFSLEESGAASQREAMVKRWCHIYKRHEGNEARVEPPTGLLCADDYLIALAKALNDTKDALKGIVVTLRKELKPDQFRTQLKSVGMLDYDLTRTYQNINVMEGELSCISWSWIVGSSKVSPITAKDLLKQTDGLDTEKKEAIERDLASFTDSTVLARVKIAKLQLRANIEQRIQGIMDSSLIVTAGPILLNQDWLPVPDETLFWRPKPEKDDKNKSYLKPKRKPRSDRVIAPDPICSISGYGIYEYLEPPKTNKRHKKAS